MKTKRPPEQLINIIDTLRNRGIIYIPSTHMHDRSISSFGIGISINSDGGGGVKLVFFAQWQK